MGVSKDKPKALNLSYLIGIESLQILGLVDYSLPEGNCRTGRGRIQ